MLTTFASLSDFVGQLHPAVVHFPVALLVAAALAEVIDAIRGGEQFAITTRFCLRIAALGAIAAAVTGWINAADKTFLEEVVVIVQRHRWLGVAVAVLSVMLLIVEWQVCKRQSKAGRLVFRIILIVTTVLVSITGHLGGKLVYGPDYLSW